MAGIAPERIGGGGAYDALSRLASPPAAPDVVRLAKALWITGAVVSALGSVLELADRRGLVAQIQREVPGYGQEQVDAAATGTVQFGLLVALGTLVLYVFLAGRMGRGANWARIALAVLGGLSVLFAVAGLAAIAAGVATALGVRVTGWQVAVDGVDLAADLVALVVMFLPAANAWFGMVRALRNRPQVSGR